MNTRLAAALSGIRFRDFFGDLKTLVSSDQQVLVAAAINWLNTYLETGTEHEAERLVTEVAKSSKTRPDLVRSVFKTLSFIAAGPWRELDDDISADNFCEDIQEISRRASLDTLSEQEIAKLRELASDLLSKGAEYRRSLALSRIRRGVLPMYEDFQATIELRSSLSPVFGSGIKLPLELFPIASVRLILDAGDRPDLYFQMSEEDVLSLADKLRELHSAMAELKNRSIGGQESDD